MIKDYWRLILGSNPDHTPDFPIRNVYSCHESPLLLAALFNGFKKNNFNYVKLLKEAQNQLQPKMEDFSRLATQFCEDDTSEISIARDSEPLIKLPQISNSLALKKNEGYKFLQNLSNQAISDFKKIFDQYQQEQEGRIASTIDRLWRYLKSLVGADFTHERAVELALAYHIVFARENDHNYSHMLDQLKNLSHNRMQKNMVAGSSLHTGLRTKTIELDKYIKNHGSEYHQQRDSFIKTQNAVATQTQPDKKDEQKMNSSEELKQKNKELEIQLQQETERHKQQEKISSQQYKEKERSFEAMLHKEREERLQKERDLEAKLQQEREARERDSEKAEREREENDRRYEQLLAMIQSQQGHDRRSEVGTTSVATSSQVFFRQAGQQDTIEPVVQQQPVVQHQQTK